MPTPESKLDAHKRDGVSVVSNGNAQPEARLLPDLPRGGSGLVARIHATNGAAKRLADMGFVRGALVEVLVRGTPCIVRIDGRRVGLGRAHQDSIELQPAPLDPAH